jgi:hypothetical protein
MTLFGKSILDGSPNPEAKAEQMELVSSVGHALVKS